MPFQPLFTSDEQYSIGELLPSIFLLDRAVGDQPISELRCHELVINSALRLAHQSSHSGLRDILDWWIVCRLNGEPNYCSFPNSFGTTGMDTDLIDRLRSMISNRNAAGSRPILEWVSMRRTFDTLVNDLQTKLGEWRNSKGIRNVGQLVNLLEILVGDAITSLKTGKCPDRPLTDSEINRLFKETDLHQGSVMYRQWSRNLKNASESMNRAIELLPQLDPFELDGLHVDQVGNGKLSGLSEDFHQATSILLRNILREPPGRRQDLASYFSELSSEDTDDIDFGQLAVIAEAVNDPGISFPSYQDLTRLRSDLPSLRKSGRDLDVVEMYLDAGMIREAREELETVRREHRDSQVLTTLTKSADRLEEVLEALRVHGLDVDHFHQEIEAFKTRLGSHDAEDPKGELTSIEARIVEASQQLLTDLSNEIIRNITCLQIGDRNIASGITQRRDDIFRKGDLQARIQLIEEITEVRRSMYAQRWNELCDISFRLQSHLQDDVDNDEIITVVSAASKLDDSDDAFDEIVRILERSIHLESDLESRKVSQWRFRDGEPALVDHIIRYMTERTGFRDLDIKRFYTSLKTKRFVILGGLPGTGKSIFPRVFGESLDCTSKNGRFLRVAVRTSWTDPSEVIGYLDSGTNKFVPGWLSTLVKQCHTDPSNLYFCLLDEMNLAPVDQYFAEVLSALEEESPTLTEQPAIGLYPDSVSPTNQDEWPARLELPTNLYFIGTVNFDPTMKAVSDRVVDRGNFIQLATRIGREHHSSITEFNETRWLVQQIEWEKTIRSAPSPDYHELLVEIGELLEDFRIGIGFRTHVEVERYLSNSKGIMDDFEAMDTAVLQRFIPKFRPTSIPSSSSLQDLWKLLRNNHLRHSAAVVRHWIDSQSELGQLPDGLDPFLGVVTSRIGQEQQDSSEGEAHGETVFLEDPTGQQLSWVHVFTRESEPLPRRQDDLLRSIVLWARHSSAARQFVTEGITCDSIVTFIRGFFGYIEWKSIVDRVRVIVREENNRAAAMPLVDIVFSRPDGVAVEVLTYVRNDGRGQPEGWRRRAVQKLSDRTSDPELFVTLISWLTTDPEASRLLRQGIEIGDIGSVAADLGYTRGSQTLTTFVHELLESHESINSQLELIVDRSQPILRWK